MVIWQPVLPVCVGCVPSREEGGLVYVTVDQYNPIDTATYRYIEVHIPGELPPCLEHNLHTQARRAATSPSF
jgi:hypothetical protein